MADLILYENWMKPAEEMNEAQKGEYFAILCLHRTGLPQRPEDAKDPMVRAVLFNVLPMIDKANISRDEGIERGKFGGRPSTVSDNAIHDYAYAHPELKADQIADYFGVSYSKITHSKGWKERNKYWF